MTPLTELRSTNLHDETTVCDQAQHTVFRAIVGKLQYTTGSETRVDVRDKMHCHTNLARPILADLTRAKKAQRYLKKNARHETLLDDTCSETE